MNSEEEQLAQLKKWWDENGVSTLASIAFAVAVVIGWQTWQNSKVSKMAQGAVAFQELTNVVREIEQSPDDIKIAQATFQADEIKAVQGGTGYGYFAALINARQAVADKDYVRAETELRWILEQNPPQEVQGLVQVRLARVHLAAGQYQQALDGLPQDTTSAYAPLIAEVRGDVLMAQEKYQQAHEAYRESEQLAMALELQAPALLSIKLQHASSFL